MEGKDEKRERQRQSDCLYSVFEETREKEGDRDTDRDNKLVSGASTLIIKQPGEDNSLKRLNRKS